MEHDIKDANVMADINVTPMVDVMLVLLIIFMVVTPSLLAGFQAKLPEGINLMAREDDDERTTLGIDINGDYYLNKKPINRDDALELLTAEFERHPDDRVLFVKADAGLRYGVMLEAMDVARDAGARVIAAVTESPASTEEEEEGGN